MTADMGGGHNATACALEERARALWPDCEVANAAPGSRQILLDTLRCWLRNMGRPAVRRRDAAGAPETGYRMTRLGSFTAQHWTTPTRGRG